MLQKIGLRFEIILNLCLVVGAALLLGGVLLLKFTEQHLVEQRVGHLAAMVNLAAATGELQDQRMSLAAVEANLQELSRSVPDGSWLLVDRDLRPLASMGSDPKAAVRKTDLAQVRMSRQPAVQLRYPGLLWPFFGQQAPRVEIARGVFSRGDFVGAIQAEFSLAQIGLRLASAHRLLLLYVLLYGTVLVGFGGYLLGRNVVRPVRTLLATTRKVAAGDLEQRLIVSGPGEIAELGEAFNRMLETLKKNRDSLERQNLSLQAKNLEIEATRDELIRSEKMASVGQLAAGMAHEVGNPLGALIGYLEFLRSELPAADQKELLERSLTEAARIDRLVRDLLDFASPDPAEIEPVEPVGIIHEALQLLEQQRQFDDVEVILEELPPALPKIRMVAHKLQQVLVNLLLNARDALPEGGRIVLTGGVDGTGAVWLRVCDSGEGVAEEMREQIFNPFFSTKPPGKGRGLGLAISHRIVDEAGGRIELERGGTGGACFCLLFPPAADEVMHD